MRLRHAIMIILLRSLLQSRRSKANPLVSAPANTKEQIFSLIEEAGTSRGLNLSDSNLENIDLGTAVIETELRKRGVLEAEVWPPWAVRRRGKPSVNLIGVDLSGSILTGANLSFANLNESDLSGCALEGANLEYADLRNANLERAWLVSTLMAHAALRGAMLKDANLYAAEMEGTRIDRAGLGAKVLQEKFGAAKTFSVMVSNNYKREVREAACLGAERVYQILMTNFESIGQFNDAVWAYIRLRRVQRKFHSPRFSRDILGKHVLGGRRWWHPKVPLFYVKHIIYYVLDWLADVICHYGYSIPRVLMALVVILLSFSCFYWYYGAVVGPDNRPVQSEIDYLIFSFGAMTNTDFERFNHADRFVEFVSEVEAFLGIAMAGLFGFVVGNRIRNR